MIEKNGVATAAMSRKEFPEEEKMLERPKAIIECYKEIPCNPCETSCPFDAITIGADINVRPQIDFEACTGCAICVYNCPGLAITVRQKIADKAILKIPYEFLPRPKKDGRVNVVNRAGEVITEGKVLKVLDNMKTNKTALIHVEIDADHLYDAMTIEVLYGS